MNIIISRSEDQTWFRPDTTLETENKDIYPHDDISGYDFLPVVFARVSKAGKCVAEEFAMRYYDALNFGLLLFPKGLSDSQNGDIAPIENRVDHTTLLPHPMYNKIVFDSENDNKFIMKRDGKTLFKCTTKGKNLCKEIESAISRITRLSSIRTGDFVCVPLAEEKASLWRREKDCTDVPVVQASFCGNFLFEFKILY
ncbi:MAG: hypothetical protein HUJ95_01115 [Bacteroidales bacterium]|nr:hypothetical protein [Bacteroidales bacterium]